MIDEAGIDKAQFSLLWPGQPAAEPPSTAAQVDPDGARDIGLARLAAALAPDSEDRQVAERVLSTLCTDLAVISYRQETLAELLERPGLPDRLAELLPQLNALARYAHRRLAERNTLQEVIWRIGELQSLVDCVTTLTAIFGADQAPASAGFKALHGHARRLADDPTFGQLTEALPELLAQVRSTASVTIGVNLDHDLQPVEATLLAISDRRFRASSLLGRLFGAAAAEWEGIAPLHSVPQGDLAAFGGGNLAAEPRLVPLFRDLADVLEKSAQPVARALRRYAGLHSGFLASLRRELPFFLGAARLTLWARQHGLPMCRPEILPLEERICEVADGYNVNLALVLREQGHERDLAQRVVTNPILLGPAARVIVLTGPNQGGKTTYVQAVGLTQIMAQAGLYVPGSRARISPVDGLYTHFPVEERLERATGRFGDEAQRLRRIFDHLSRHSLLLMNESLASTSAGEGFYIGQDILRVLRRLGARAIFSTHLHELAASAEELNAQEAGDSRIASMVASPIEQEGVRDDAVDEIQRSYRVALGPPLGRSYAREIAARHGVSYEQLAALLQERGCIAG